MKPTRLRSAIPAACVLAAFAMRACTEADPCAGGACPGADAGARDGGAPDAGPHPGSCSPACPAARPACDFETAQCRVCTATRGCYLSSAPYCDVSVPDGRCVGCRDDADCDGGTCSAAKKTCSAPPAAPDAGPVEVPDGGGEVECTVSLECDPPCAPGEVCIAGRCSARVPCAEECDHGFHCVQGECVLNGGGGDLQVTLRFSDPEDLDLHVVEPGGCEIYYGNPVCEGSLDLDSNAGCAVDNVDIENVVYEAGNPPPSGTYRVRVDYYQNCTATKDVPFQVVVRKGGVVTGYCGVFSPGADDMGQGGSGRDIVTFTYP